MSSSIQLPPPIGPGDRVGIAALSGPVAPEALERGLAEIERLGFRPVPADNLASRYGLFAGSDDDRLAAFHRLARRSDLGAIFFVRGGHGVLRLLEKIDWPLLSRFPRFYVGYSDLTPFLNAIVDKLSLVAVHGPMVAVEMARGLMPTERDSLMEVLRGDLPMTRRFRARLVAGEGEGSLVGGCLSMLVATLGTAFAPRLDDRILFFEDVNEPPYRIDRMLTQLRLSGTLEGVRAVVVGGSLPLGDESGPEGEGCARELLSALGAPVIAGLASGHESPNLALPLGLKASIHGEDMRLIFGSSSPSGEGS